MFHLLNLFILIISVQILTVALIFMFYFLQTEMSMFWPDTADNMIAEKLFRESDLGPFLPPDRKRHTSELQSHHDLVCRLLLEKKKKKKIINKNTKKKNKKR